MSYDSFGVEGNSPSIDRFVNPFGFTGYQRENVGGMLYAQARYYMPGNGRFNAEDPIRSGLNWYDYCGANPIRYVDPLGLFYVVRERELLLEHWRWGTFFGEPTGNYSIWPESRSVVWQSTVTGLAPVHGLFLSNIVQRPDLPGDVIDGTSKTRWNYTIENFGLHTPIIDMSIRANNSRETSLGTFLEGLGRVRGLNSLSTGFSGLFSFFDRENIYYHGNILFGIMNIYDMPTQFSSREALDTQLNILLRMIDRNPSLFGITAADVPESLRSPYPVYKDSLFLRLLRNNPQGLDMNQLNHFLLESIIDEWTARCS